LVLPTRLAGGNRILSGIGRSFGNRTPNTILSSQFKSLLFLA